MKIAHGNRPVAENVKRLIAQRGEKQYVIAHRARLTPQALNAMLCGRKVIRAADVPALAKALNVEPNRLFEEGG